LRDLAYVEGRTFVIEYRSAAWNVDLLADLAVELDIPPRCPENRVRYTDGNAIRA
jgi:hypothetical protein